MSLLKIVAACALIGLGGAGTAQAAAPDGARTALNTAVYAGPAGSPPPYSELEYRPYFGSGTSTLVVHIALHLQDGSTRFPTGTGSTYAYPDTPYSRWMLHAYAYALNGATLVPGMDFPGDRRTGITVPAYLNVVTMHGHPATTAVKEPARCDGTGTCVFEHIPAGRYLILSLNAISAAGTGYRKDVTPGIEPNGDQTLEIRETPYDMSREVYGFTLIGGYFSTRAGEVTYGKRDAIMVRASYRIDRTR